MNNWNLDFRTKLLYTIVLATLSIGGKMQQGYTILAVFVYGIPFVLLWINRKYNMAIKSLLLYIIGKILATYVIAFSTGVLMSVIMLFNCFALNLLPGAMMGYYMVETTRMSDMIASLRKMKTPDFITIPLSVMIRFFYSIKEDYSSIKRAMKLYGLLEVSMFFKPIKMVEYRIVPLLMCSSKTADDVAIAAMTRGLKVGQQRSSVSDVKLHIIDYLFFLLAIVLVVLSII